MSLWLLGRRKSSEGPFKGIVTVSKCDHLRDEEEFHDSCDLNYLEFMLSPTRPTVESFDTLPGYLALCVLDFDLQDELKQQVCSATLAGKASVIRSLCEKELELIHDLFRDCEGGYRVYASGSKGLHVYVKDPRLLVKSDTGCSFFVAAPIKVILENSLPDARFVELLRLGVVDISPYHHGRGIRPFTCAHPSTGVIPFVIKEHNWNEDETWFDWVRSAIRSGQHRHVRDFADAERVIPVNVQRSSTPGTPPLPQPRRVHVVDQTLNRFTRLSLLQWLKDKSGQSNLTLGKQVKQYQYFTLPGASGTYCALANKIHKTCCSSWQSFGNGVHVCQCFNSNCSRKQLILRKPIPRPVTYPRDTEIAPENLTLLADNENNSPYLPDTVMDLFKDHPRIVLNASMSSGKTYRVMRFIESLDPSLRIVVVGSRIQQIKAWHSKFSTLGFEIYDEAKGSLFEKKRILVCMNSLPRLLGPDGELPAIDVIVLDECDSAARWLGGPLLGSSPYASQSFIFLILSLLIGRAKNVILMDGLPTKCTGRFLEVMGCFDKFHWVVHQSLKFKKWKFVNSTKYFTKAFIESLRSGKRLFFVSNSKKFLYVFAEIATKHAGLDPNRVLVISGDMSNENRIAAGNPDDWIRYDLLLCNGSLGPGASFDDPDHFHSVFVLVNVNNGVTPIDIAQLAERVRHTTESKVTAMVLKKEPEAEDVHQTESEILTKKLKTVGRYSRCAVPVVQVHESERARLAREKAEQQHQEDLERGRVPRANAPPPVGTIMNFKTIYDESTDQLRDVFADPGVSIRLIFEETPEMRLAAAVDELSRFWTRDSESFLQALQKIVTQGGSSIETIGRRTMLDAKGKDIILGSHMSYYKSLKKNQLEGEFDELAHIEDNYYLRTVLPSLTEAQAIKAKELADVANPGTMKRFAKVYRWYNGTIDSVESAIVADGRSLFMVPPTSRRTSMEPPNKVFINQAGLPRAAITRKATNGEIFNHLNNLIAELGFVIDPELRTFEGRYETKDFITADWETKKRQCGYLRELCKLRQREDPSFTWRALRNENTPKPFVKFLLEMFEWCGLPLVRSKPRRTFIPGYTADRSKTMWYVLTPDEKTFKFRKALVDSEEDTVDAVKQFFIQFDQ